MDELAGLPPFTFFERACEYIFDGIRQDIFVAKMFVLMDQAFANSRYTLAYSKGHTTNQLL